MNRDLALLNEADLRIRDSLKFIVLRFGSSNEIL